jgi:hypothetical protein
MTPTEPHPSLTPAEIRRTQLMPFYLVALAACILFLDCISGPQFQFPILYTVPVLLAAWYRGCVYGYSLAVVMPLVRFFMRAVWQEPSSLTEALANLVIRLFVLVLVAFLVEQAARRTREVKVLRGFFRVCSHCRRIHTPEKTWVQMERYISEHSETAFSHGICPECVKKHYPDYLDKMRG